VEIELNPVPDGAYEGQFARADIELTATNRLVIPVHTIHYEPKGAYVYRIVEKDNDDKSAKQTIAEKIYFEQGQQFGSVIEVLTELSVGDKIVSRGYLGLRDGKKVIVANGKAKTMSNEQ
jgi:membrane fusion protein (multidrug efflux system)